MNTSSASAPSFSLRPLLFAYMCGTMAMMAFVAVIGPLSRHLGLLPWQAGLAVTAGGLLWMVAAPIWGRLSDQHGRRRILVTGFAGFFISYLALGIGLIAAMHVPMASWLVFAGLVATRGAVGGFYAAAPTASQALIADNLPPERRVNAMASLGMANGVGLVLGPALAGQLAWFGLEAPLYLTTLLPLLGLVALWKYLPDAPPPAGGRRGGRSLLTDPRLRRPMITAFTALFTVSASQIAVGFFVIDQLGMSPEAGARTAGNALGMVGIALILSQLVVRRLTLRPIPMIRIGMSVAGLGFVSVMLVTQSWMLMVSYFVAAAGMGFVFPAFSALAANSVQPNEQGAAAGAVGAAQGLGTVLGPLAGAMLLQLTPGLPYAVSGVLLALVAIWVGLGHPTDDGQHPDRAPGPDSASN